MLTASAVAADRYSAAVRGDPPPPVRRRQWAVMVPVWFGATVMLAIGLIFGLSAVLGFSTRTTTGQVAAMPGRGFEARIVTDRGVHCDVGMPSDPPPGITVTVRYSEWFSCLNARVESDERWWTPDVLVSVTMAAVAVLAVLARLRYLEKAERRRDPTWRVLGRRAGRSAGH